MKDNFSTKADDYARYRPGYPDKVFEYLGHILPTKENAWDCATGNGQVAVRLASFFDQVYATDISKSQLEHAPRNPNIQYSLQSAEKTDFPADFFDLITVGQAIHWFDFERFYAEVKRTARKNALLVILGYGRIQVNPDIDQCVDELYTDIVGKYWDAERKYVEEGYRTIPFPFEELPVPFFSLSMDWTLGHLRGYLETWSAVKHYRRHHQKDPVALIYPELKAGWGEQEKRTVNFPLLLRIGKIN
jgi:SAM-dependent methyltransferase